MPEETKPTQPLLADILEEMRGGFARIETELHDFRSETNDRLLRIEKRLASLEGTEGVLIDKMTEIQVEQMEIKRRTLDLERKSTQ